MKEVRLAVRITEEQNKLLITKANAYGYTTVSDYVRSMLFRSLTTEDKIDAIHKRICKN